MAVPDRYEVVCPHCGKSFDGELLAERTPLAGFKCPHCRLFFPLERVEQEPPETDPAPAPG